MFSGQLTTPDRFSYHTGGGLTKMRPADGLNSAKDSFQKTLLFIKLCKSKSKNPIHLMGEGVHSADQFCNNIRNRRSTFGPLIGSGRLPETSGDQMPDHNFTCQHNAASRRKNQSAARQSLTKQKY